MSLFIKRLWLYNSFMRYSSYSHPAMSRRAYRETCEWWQRTTVQGQLPLYKMAHSVAPSGKFSARNVSNHFMGKREDGDFRFTNGFVTVETPDDISSLRPDDLVKYEGIFYRVDSIQRMEDARTRDNMKHPLSRYLIQLVR